MADDEVKVAPEGGGATGEHAEGEEGKRNWNYPLIKASEIPADTKTEILDTITAAVERYAQDLEMACKSIKEEMDRLYDPYWHVIIGENFGFEIHYETQNMIYLFYMGNLGILLWKCS